MAMRIKKRGMATPLNWSGCRTVIDSLETDDCSPDSVLEPFNIRPLFMQTRGSSLGDRLLLRLPSSSLYVREPYSEPRSHPSFL